MTKESIIELQKIDCNCNDCGLMTRNMFKPKEVLIDDKESQLEFFRSKKARSICKARRHKDPKKREAAIKDAVSLTFNYFFQRTPDLYGYCNKFHKNVTFIPNTCQLHTQKCFVHRRDLKS